MKTTNFMSEKFVPSRPLDYIYDPIYTFSGSKGFYRAANEAQKSSSEYSVQPIFSSMFSDMVRYPNANLVLRSSQRPQSIDSSYQGKLRATLQEKTERPQVTGTDRYKYFRRPVTESQSVSPPATRFPLLGGERVTTLGTLAPPATAQLLPTRSSRMSTAAQSRAVQTDYRESETQTRPWAPPFVSHSDNPEVLFLDQLAWGDGLPPGRHEVEVVERLRKKRAWEAQLPPPDCDVNIKTRYKLIAEMEKSDWQFREQEVEAVHRERMKKCGEILEQHVLLNRAKLTTRMEFLQDDINKRKDKKIQMFRHNKERALRKLCIKEKIVKQQKKNVIDELLSHTSELNAPKKRLGYSFRNKDLILAEKSINIDKTDINPEKVAEYRPVFDFERLSRPKKQGELCFRETRWNMNNLIKLHQDLQALHKKEREKNVQVDVLVNPTDGLVPRSSARYIPIVPQTDESSEKLYQAATLLQRVIQGRAKQSMMHSRREQLRETLEELKIAESMTKKERDVFLDEKRNFINESKLAGVLEDIVGLNVGLTISQTLELLAKELLHIKSEAEGHSRALEAECDRWKRESAEGGRRQREKIRREEHGLMFSQLMQVYQDSVNEFMEAIVNRARENEAKIQAFEYAKEMAVLAEIEEAQRRAKELEPVSADALFEFIAPEGLQALTRTCMLILRQKYLEARQRLVDTCRAEPKASESKDHIDKETKLSPIQEQEQVTEEDSHFTVKSDSFHDHSRETSKTSTKAETSVIQQDFEILQTSSSEILQTSSSDILQTSSSEILQTSSRSLATFGLISSEDSVTLEERLLTKVIQDMCYVSGALFHTAAKVLNKALRLAGIPQESFEEALARTMHVINEARDEVVRLIVPCRQTSMNEAMMLPSQIASEEIILQATKIVDDILKTAKERIKERQRFSMSSGSTYESDAQGNVKKVIEDILRESELRVFRSVVEDFLSDLFKEAQEKVALINNEFGHNIHI